MSMGKSFISTFASLLLVHSIAKLAYDTKKQRGLLLSAYPEACSTEVQTPPKRAMTAVNTCWLARVALQSLPCWLHLGAGGEKTPYSASPAAMLGSWLTTHSQRAPCTYRGLQCLEQNHMCKETLVHTAVIQQRGGDMWKTVKLKELWVTLERKHGIYCHMGEEKRCHIVLGSLNVVIMTHWENY